MSHSTHDVRLNSSSFRPAQLLLVVVALLSGAALSAECQTSANGAGLLASRSELIAAAAQAEVAARSGDPAKRAESAMVAQAIRQRLQEGDIQVGDRVIVAYMSDALHRDTVVVRSGRLLAISPFIVVPMTGVLRSELLDSVSAALLKYVKAENIEVTPLTRIAVLGEVGRPGYFAFRSDIPLADAIMNAGGPTGSAAFDRSVVRRGNQEYRSAALTSKAISGGVTLDQFGLSAGDELVVGTRRNFDITRVISVAGASASIVALVVTIRRGSSHSGSSNSGSSKSGGH